METIQFDDESSSSERTYVSTTESKNTNNAEALESQGEEVAQKETMELQRSKQAVFAIITMAAVLCGASTYMYSSIEEDDLFESEYNDLAVEVIDIVTHQASGIFQAVDNLATLVTSSSIESRAEWPNVTVANFEAKASKINALSKSQEVSLVPIVDEGHRLSWEHYSVANQKWIDESLRFQGSTADAQGIPQNIWGWSGFEFGDNEYAPVWQMSPPPTNSSIIVNFDLFSDPVFKSAFHNMSSERLPLLSEIADVSFLFEGSADEEYLSHPHSSILYPVFPSLGEGAMDYDPIVAFLVSILSWDRFFSDLLPHGMGDVVVALDDGCGDSVSYRINGPEATFLGFGNTFSGGYAGMGRSSDLLPFIKYNRSDYCRYELTVYPTSDLEQSYMTKKPVLYAVMLVSVFMFTALVFVFYDVFVEKRMNVVIATAKQSNDIVASLFPSHVRDRLMQDAQERAERGTEGEANHRGSGTFGFAAALKSPVKTFLDEGAEEDIHPFGTRPIADLFPQVTVMFADITGFTAWSSVREPSQVFTLLETVYAAFDRIAEKRRVFKVETVGDCYVAAAGLPDNRKDHAVVMARFARDCLTKVNYLTKRLEVTLGPDTGDLSMRFGLHSGPVTAGVLRGEKSRFQLFGDTVNTAARMESTGQRNRIQISEDTANLLFAAGKTNWCKLRDEKVHAKGKGQLQTYWLARKLSGGKANHSFSKSSNEYESDNNTSTGTPGASEGGVGEKQERLIDWNTEVLSRLLKQIIVRRKARSHRNAALEESPSIADLQLKEGQTVIDEVREIIRLPEFDPEVVRYQDDPDSIVLDEVVVRQLRHYVTVIASTYHDNPFHNFEHASHVAMSVIKLLSRIVAPTDVLLEEDGGDDIEHAAAMTLHDHTYGITSDPLTQFACVFTALIHDADHPGVPNAQLVKEVTPLAVAYHNKSVAEQNSVDLAWKLFMNDDFKDLRNTICPSAPEQQRFRQLVVNSVMATDIVDKELKALRNARWDTAFQERSLLDRDNVNRKATIVIEHIIQASDVSHTMQHWHVYRKWNERLFHEMYHAYKTGRSEKDPSEFWCKGEIGFLDFYIIPLAKKLKDCGVFGVSSDEYLNYAQKNRQEWEHKGKEVVDMLVEKYRALYEDDEVEDASDNEGEELAMVD